MTLTYDLYDSSSPGNSGKVQTKASVSTGDTLTVIGGGTTLVAGSTFTTSGSGTVYTYVGYVVDGSSAILVATTGSGASLTYYQFYPSGLGTLSGNQPFVQGGTYNVGAGTASCFLSGTMIATPDGERAIETLKAGDLVLTADGVAKPVRWLGHTVVSGVFGDRSRVVPVRIKAGALGANVPARDLLVSAGHALLVEGVLVNAAALVNGTSIVREDGIAANFTYYHLELDTHAVILAEGAPAESFLDSVEELGFANWADRVAPADARELDYPRAKSARQLPPALRARLAARAADLVLDKAVAA